MVTLPDEVLTVQAAQNARRHLYSGVTTVRECGAKNRTTFLLRQAVEMGIVPSPRLVLSGRPVAIVGGHLSYFGIQATGPTECRAAVRQLIKEGARLHQDHGNRRQHAHQPLVQAVFRRRRVDGDLRRGPQFGKHAAAHCASSQGMVNALDAGIDTIIHGVHKEPDGSDVFRPEIADRIAEQGVLVNATLGGGVVRIRMLEADDNLSAAMRSELDAFRHTSEVRLDNFARMRDAGVMMAAGSDSAWGYYRMGDFQSEIEAPCDRWDVQHGRRSLRPRATPPNLAGSIHRSAPLETRANRLTSLVVDGNPLDDINQLRWRGRCLPCGGSRRPGQPRLVSVYKSKRESRSACAGWGITR